MRQQTNTVGKTIASFAVSASLTVMLLGNIFKPVSQGSGWTHSLKTLLIHA